MRTIALLAIMGMIAAAQEPKPTPAAAPVTVRLNSAEITAFNHVQERKNAIRQQYAVLEKEFSALEKLEPQIQADACLRGFKNPICQIKPDGTMTEAEKPKPEVKK